MDKEPSFLFLKLTELLVRLNFNLFHLLRLYSTSAEGL